MIICYTVPWIWCVTDVVIFHFGLFFATPPPLTAQKIKISKKQKNKKHLEISFCTCVPKTMITCCAVPELWCAMERWMEKVT